MQGGEGAAVKSTPGVTRLPSELVDDAIFNLDEALHHAGMRTQWRLTNGDARLDVWSNDFTVNSRTYLIPSADRLGLVAALAEAVNDCLRW